MRRRCGALHDIVEHPPRVLRCQRDEGHAGDCKPEGWESISRAEYLRLSSQLREAK